MKHICIYLALTCMGVTSLSAQTSLPYNHAQTLPIAQHLYDAGVHHGGRPLELMLPPSFTMADQRPYLIALAKLMSQERSDAEVIEAFIIQHPASLDRSRAYLMLTLLYWERSDWERAYTSLDKVVRDGLNDTEASQYYLLQAYRALSSNLERDEAVGQAESLLVLATETDNEWSERALLTLVSLRWYRGERERAQSILSQTRWSEALQPDVAYVRSLIAFEGSDLSSAIAEAQNAMRLYPALRSRVRLHGAIGQAYYRLGDYAGAQSSLERAQGLGVLTAPEAFSYGWVLHRAGSYSQAIPQLMLGAEDKGRIGLLSQFYLADSYVRTQQSQKAQLIYTALINHPDADPKLREESHYQSIEVGHSGRGSDAFGQTLQRVEQFLLRYPQSKHYARVWELLAEYLSTSKAYEQSLAILNRLGKRTADANALRQEVTLSWALSEDRGSGAYLSRLNDAIALGPKSTAYSSALCERAGVYLASGDYAKALQDATLAGGNSWPKQDSGLKLRSHYLQGYALYNMQRYAEAKAMLQSALELSQEASLRADILCRLGDCALATAQGYATAQGLYQQAVTLVPTDASEPLERIAYLQGLQGRWQEQIATLDVLLADYPDSPIRPTALYNKGRALLIGAKDSRQAMQVFSQVQEQYPTSAEAPTSALEQSLILSNAGDTQAAIQSYKALVSRYPASPEAKSALEDLRALYADADRSDDYLAYIRSLPPHLRPEGEQTLRLQYQGLQSRLRRGEAQTEELLTFLREYPTSTEAQQIESTLLDRYRAQKAWQSGVDYLQHQLASNPPATRAEQMREQLIDFYRRNGQVAQALSTARELYKQAGKGSAKQISAGLSVVELANEAGQYQEANSLATDLLKGAKLSTEQRHAFTLGKGVAQESLKAFNGAVATYATVEKDQDTPQRAEATVRRASIHLRLKEAQKSVDILEQFIAKGSSHNYWLARAFVLLCDAHFALGETYMSQQYIESLRENYKGTEADIWQMISEREEQYKLKK